MTRRAARRGALLAGVCGAALAAWGGLTLTAQVADPPATPAERIATLEKRAAADPRPDLYFELGRLRLAQGQDDAALQDLARAAAIAPEGHYVHAYLGHQLDKAKYQHRIDLLEALVKIAPKDPPLLERLGLLYQGAGRNDEAEALFTRWVRLRPDSPGAPARLAEFYRATDRPKEAIPRLEKVRDLSGESTYALRRLGVLYRETGDLDASAQRLQMAISEAEGVRKTAAGMVKGLKPGETERDLVALVELGHTRLAQKRPADAVAAYAQAVALDPESPAYHLFLARAQEAKGDVGAARAAYEKTVALDPFSLQAQLAFGNLLLSQGDPKGALAHLKEASSRNDRDPELHFLVGETAIKAGDMKAAAYEHDKLKQIRSTTLARKLFTLIQAHPGGQSGPSAGP